MNTMTHNGYAARVEFDAEDRIFVGHIAGIQDIVTFHGETVGELEQAFQESVDGYLENCRRLGKRPQKAASGKLMLRVDPELHRAAQVAAEVAGKSLNQWASEVIDRAAR